MKLYIIARHRVKDELTLREYETGAAMLARAAASESDALKFGLKLSLDPHMGRELYERALDITRSLPREMYIILDPERRGSGVSFRQVVFNAAFMGSIVTCVDLDQFILDTPGAVQKLSSLAARLDEESLLYGIGARDVPVVLAKHNRASDLRIIHELFHSLAMGITSDVDVPTAAYAAIGESTPGCYMFNTMHERYPALLGAVMGAAYEGDLHMYAAEYYCMIKASQLGGGAMAAVEAKENPIFDRWDEDEDVRQVCLMIAASTGALARTDIAPALQAALLDEVNVRRISEFYSRDDVLLVRDLMLSRFQLIEQ